MTTATHPRSVALASKILQAYVANNNLPAAALPTLLTDLTAAIRGLAAAGSAPAAKATPAEIAASVRPDAIVSFENGRAYRTLRRHLTERGLTPESYRAKWGLPDDYPLIAPDYARLRADIARGMGLGRPGPYHQT